MLKLVIRPLVSLALLGLLFWKLGAGELWSMLLQADLAWLAAGIALVLVALAVSAWKWQLLLEAQGLTVPVPALFNSYLVGLFFNNFLPSNIGGDVVRVHDVAKRTGQASAVAASVIAERLLAGLALALTAAVALLFSAEYTARVGPSIGLALFVFAALLGAAALPGSRAWLERVLPAGRAQAVARVTGQMGQALRNRNVVVAVLALSFVFQAAVVLVAWAGFAAIGVPVSLGACFLFIPIISAVQLVPVSLNGLGVREGAYVVFFGSIGVGEVHAAAASLLFGLLVAGVSLAGGLLFAARR
ncbi:MAG TPA: lysylphosphatidylglycerol synthase transmembrane domain-containing protein [Chloroflexota bacterium]|nr:lysylphosphatidylglycerol synthase transmembrane domain-containing protein [Chloroflexota bacterium]